MPFWCRFIRRSGRSHSITEDGARNAGRSPDLVVLDVEGQALDAERRADSALA